MIIQNNKKIIIIINSGRFWTKPSRINFGRFFPNRPESEFWTKILDGFKPSTKNRMGFIPDGFFTIYGRFETVQNW
jgi:hypothetical protein